MIPVSTDERRVVCRIRTPRLLLRLLHPDDAPVVCAAIAASLPHLQRWMAWAMAEPVTLDVKTEQLRKARRASIAGASQAFGMFSPDGLTLVGAIGTHTRIGAGAREIGYWLAESHVKQGFTTEAAAALVRIGFELQNLRRMEIHTDPDNLASIGVARKLGFREQVTMRNCVLSPDSPVRDSVMWAMSREQYPNSYATTLAIEALDGRGERVR